jgi:predicted N-acetyltransferase YhbS
VQVRPIETAQDQDAYARLCIEAFGAAGDPPPPADRVRGPRAAQGGGPSPHTVRGAFRDGRLVGGYTLHDRRMRLGGVVARTAGVGGVVTAPAHRLTGVGRALMEDAVREARGRGFALLLLNGIPQFYRRFGFVDVWDPDGHVWSSADVAALPPSGLRVRPATVQDAAAVERLFRRHFRRYTGSFARGADVTAGLLGDPGRRLVHVATSPAGAVRGYLVLNPKRLHTSREVAADDRAAVVALARLHARLAAAPEDPPAELTWFMPRQSLAFAHLSDLVGVRSETRRAPDADWLARPAAPRALARLAAAVAARRAGAGTPPAVALDGLPTAGGPPVAHLSGAVWLQLAFGHRPPEWAAQQPGQRIPRRHRAMLEATLPDAPAWIAGMDWF